MLFNILQAEIYAVMSYMTKHVSKSKLSWNVPNKTTHTHLTLNTNQRVGNIEPSKTQGTVSRKQQIYVSIMYTLQFILKMDWLSPRVRRAPQLVGSYIWIVYGFF